MITDVDRTRRFIGEIIKSLVDASLEDNALALVADILTEGLVQVALAEARAVERRKRFQAGLDAMDAAQAT